MSHPHPVPGSIESIEFEITDFAEARQVLDAVPANQVAESEPNYWAQRRRELVATDRALTGATMNWVVELPTPLRPIKLCERFPRIANSIALAWRDRAQFDALLDGLLNDKRARRRGFPLAVRQELERLIEYRADGT